MSRARNQEGCELNMTPMIDVVFQLIIFFIVTITMTENRNEEIRLEKAIHGEVIDGKQKSSPLTFVIEVDRKGRVSINGFPTTFEQLRNNLDYRRRKYDVFPVMIRADSRTQHRHVAHVMGICTELGIGRVSFVAIKDPRTPESKARWN